jgi:hypothetical protein
MEKIDNKKSNTVIQSQNFIKILKPSKSSHKVISLSVGSNIDSRSNKSNENEIEIEPKPRLTKTPKISQGELKSTSKSEESNRINGIKVRLFHYAYTYIYTYITH